MLCHLACLKMSKEPSCTKLEAYHPWGELRAGAGRVLKAGQQETGKPPESLEAVGGELQQAM